MTGLIIRRFIASLSIIGSAAIAELVPVTFRLQVESLPEPQQVYLIGDHTALGSWTPPGVLMEESKQGAWSVTLPFKIGTELAYKFTRGSWTTEALASSGDIPPNHTLLVQEETEAEHVVLSWKDQRPGVASQITGTIIYHRDMAAPGLLPRDVLVWLPPDYDDEPDSRYPVLYMHDGQQIMDPATSTHGKDWQVDEWATHFIQSGQMEPIIIVGNYCTRDRGNEYGENDDKDALYRSFLIDTLKPFIDKTYRTRPGREHTAVMGASMGGIASFKMVYKHPEHFSMAGCLSSAFWMDFDALKEADWPKAPVKIYMDNGGVGLEKKLQPGNDTMLDILQDKSFTLGNNLLWCYAEDAEHNEQAWSDRVWMPLLYFFGTDENDWITDLPDPPPMPENSLR